MTVAWQNDPRYTMLEKVLSYLDRYVDEQPSLKTVAEVVGMSPYHFQRTFRRWVGISPKQYLQQLSLERAKQLLAAGQSVLDAALQSGLSGPSRLHDLFVTFDAVTPGQFKKRGEGLDLRWGVAPSPFGTTLIAWSVRGIVALSFPGRFAVEEALTELKKRWPGSRMHEDHHEAFDLAERVFNHPFPNAPIHLHLRGTNFRIKVWQALLCIPPAHLATYGDLARFAGAPSASRAVGHALANNPIGWLIPCHRVIQASGKLGNYHWGPARKRAMINWEQARRAISRTP